MGGCFEQLQQGHLQPGVHLEEVELGRRLVHQELDRPCRAIPGSFSQLPGCCRQLLAQPLICMRHTALISFILAH